MRIGGLLVALVTLALAAAPANAGKRVDFSEQDGAAGVFFSKERAQAASSQRCGHPVLGVKRRASGRV